MLKERLAAEMRAALKGGEKLRLGTLRLLAASVKNREVELRHELSDEELVEVAVREVKRRAEAIEAYEKGGRPDRAEVERQEMQVLQAYVPAALSEDELDALIDQAVLETGASGPGDLGAVMRYVMERARGRADGQQVQERVRGRLTG